jgi:hypothetical protein
VSANGWVESPHPRIFKASTFSVKLFILSPIASWYAHRLNESAAEELGVLASRPVRCGGERCRLCGDFQRISRAVVLAIDMQKREWFLYLTERNRKVFEELRSTHGQAVKVWKRGGAPNSPLEIVLDGTHEYRMRDIEPLTAKFDQAAWLEDAPSLRVAT